jgi:hypothetical protein
MSYASAHTNSGHSIGHGSGSRKPSLDQRSNTKSGDKSGGDKKRLEQKFKKVSHLFHRSKTEDDRLGMMNNGSGSGLADAGYEEAATVGDIPPPRSATVSFYSLKDDSSGTLIGRQRSLDTQLPTLNTYSSSLSNHGINNVEFTNIRNEQAHNYSSDSISSPTTSSIMEKTRDSKIGRFLSMTGHKVKKLSDVNNEPLNLGLGLHGHVHVPGHGYEKTQSHGGFPLFQKGIQSKDLKSPISRTFGKSSGEPKMSFSEKLKQLNSTKYKNYHYHNLLRNKKDSLRNGMKLGSKNGDNAGGPFQNGGILAGTSIALSDINFQEIEIMIDSGALNFEQCEQYCAFILGRVQHLLLFLFRGEALKCPIEDVTKLVSLYVRLRKVQENVSRKDAEQGQQQGLYTTLPTPTSTSHSHLNLHSLSQAQSQSQSQSHTQLAITDDDKVNELETPFMKSPSVFGHLPTTGVIGSQELNSPTAFSPMMKVGGTGMGLGMGMGMGLGVDMSFNAAARVKEEINEILRQGLGVMIGQIYYDESCGDVRFMRGGNASMRKRKNTVNSFGESTVGINGGNVTGSTSTIINEGDDVYSLADVASANGSEFPLLTPTNTHTWTSIYNDKEGEYGDGSTLNLGPITMGGFNKCTALLWDIFQRYVMYEMTSILLPVELEFANGHRETSRVHARANSILYNRGERLRTFTNTMVHSDILKYDTTATDYTTIGTLGEWTDLNVRNLLLVGFRDHIVIPLYEATRSVEEEEHNTNVSPSTAAAAAAAAVIAYMDRSAVAQCLQCVAAVDTLDTNQKLVENLLAGRRV